MIIQATLLHGQCFFEDLPSIHNEKSLIGKKGIDYCRFQFLGAIFSWLGITSGIDCKVGERTIRCHIYKKDFKHWVLGHKNDVTLAHDYGNGHLCNNKNLQKMISKIDKITESSMRQYIIAITQNHKSNLEVLSQRKINPGNPLTVKQVLAKAKKDFANHIYEKEILREIQKVLDRSDPRSYKNSVREGIPPYFKDGDSTYFMWAHQKYPGMEGYEEYKKKCDLFFIVHEFLESLPGVDTSPYTGSYLE